MVEVVNCVFIGKFIKHEILENSRLNSKKNKQILIYKPKYRETPMKSKTRHVDGGDQNPLVHCKVIGNTSGNTNDIF